MSLTQPEGLPGAIIQGRSLLSVMGEEMCEYSEGLIFFIFLFFIFLRKTPFLKRPHTERDRDRQRQRQRERVCVRERETERQRETETERACV